MMATGHSPVGSVALWLVGSGVIATIGFGYRELVLHDR
jgi:hypothetical protein